MNKHTVSALVENKFGVLARVSGMLSGRGFNIETLNVAPTHDPKISRITATILADETSLNRCIRQLDKLVNVITVQNFDGVDFVARELVMVKVKADQTTRSQILEIAGIFRAQIIDVSLESLIIEFTGNANKINALLKLLNNYEIIEMARTGTLTLERGINSCK
ncbi:acetolactate synthase small subunit [Candidatus Spyradosoma sp. SGI.093]|uniref:acetolactate synthase small subunit n=1 Tax=Candidatus Spyradosoma sp. SGI.093 TaxID=3420583 RepID=UPI003D07824A